MKHKKDRNDKIKVNYHSHHAVTITLPQPKADLTATQIEAAMDEVIAKNNFPYRRRCDKPPIKYLTAPPHFVQTLFLFF